MNMREEDRQKSSCSSRGLGLAAAAIGVGVGAALYYFFSKQPENPGGEGSTSDWRCDQAHVFEVSHDDELDSSTSASDWMHTTSDTSMTSTTESHSTEDPTDSYYSSDFTSTSDFDLDESDTDTFMDTDEWDITQSSGDIPSYDDVGLTRHLSAVLSPRYFRRNRIRERSWSLEECSICFDEILREHQVTTLPCTHHFHSRCIAPWLREQQTCPNCRKAAE